jgi:hypothetical protein
MTGYSQVQKLAKTKMVLAGGFDRRKSLIFLHG